MTRNFDKRVSALEDSLPDTGWRVVLDALSDADLDRLEAILIAKEAGMPIEAMPDDDLRLLASLRVAPVSVEDAR